MENSRIIMDLKRGESPAHLPVLDICFMAVSQVSRMTTAGLWSDAFRHIISCTNGFVGKWNPTGRPSPIIIWHHFTILRMKHGHNWWVRSIFRYHCQLEPHKAVAEVSKIGNL